MFRNGVSAAASKFVPDYDVDTFLVEYLLLTLDMSQ